LYTSVKRRQLDVYLDTERNR